jgi:hypothetical protein
MSEPIGNSFRTLVAAGILLGALSVCAALYLLSQGELIGGVVLGAITYFLFRMFWRSTLRKRELLRRGYYIGRRVGTHWVYDELQDGLIESLEFPLEYIGRGEYDIHIPGQQDWRNGMPPWARERRDEIVDKLATVFKRSQIHFEPDSAQSPPASG